MIRGVHTMFYTSEPEALRAFLRDSLGLKGTDVGGGWLIFDLPEADMGCHPTEKGEVDAVPSGTPHISFYCDDLDETMRELRAQGVEFVEEVSDVGYGRRTSLRAPGNFTIELYEPGYAKD
jgi:catechol 2,3-dioxygenase-like lactoylglutathione lyase family enzyme